MDGSGFFDGAAGAGAGMRRAFEGIGCCLDGFS